MKRAAVALVLMAGAAGLLWALRANPPEQRTAEPEAQGKTAPEPLGTGRPPATTAAPEDLQRKAQADTPYANEEAYLRALEALRRSDKEAALELARRGESWYSDRGVFAEARSAMVATLLVDLGRMAEARAEVRRFLAQHPESRYGPMLRGMTGIHPRPGPPPSVEP